MQSACAERLRWSRFPLLSIIVLALAFTGSCSKDELLEPGSLFNINAPVLEYPSITLKGVSGDTVAVGDTIRVFGTGFDRILKVRFGDKTIQEYTIVRDTIGFLDTDSGEMTRVDTLEMVVPRRSVSGTLSVEDIYGQTVRMNEEVFLTYPYVAVFIYPEYIERERRFKLGGKAVDLLKEVILVGENSRITLPVKDENVLSEDEITVLTIGVMIPDSLITMEFVPLKEEIEILIPPNGISNKEIPVIDPQPYDPIEPLILWNFNTEPIFDNSDAQFGTVAQAGINLAEGVDPIRGNFYTVILNEVPETPETPRGASWAYLGRIQKEEMPDGSVPIDLGGFNEPYVTFLVNTNGNYGYFQFVVNTTDGLKYGTHGMFNFIYKNEGWEWKTFKFEDLRWELWGGEGPKAPDPNGTFEYIRLGYTTADIPTGSYFEISVDEVMITDGPLHITDTLFLFEDGTDRFTEAPGIASSVQSSLGGSSVDAFEGEGYQTVAIASVEAQNETVGEIRYSGNYSEELKYMNAPHLSFWVNTGNKKGYMKLVAYEGSTRFICNLGEIDTGGEWMLVTKNIRAETIREDASETKIDFGSLTDLALEIYTGDAENGSGLEINLDYVVVSDGPLY
jgi:hypothetical protein